MKKSYYTKIAGLGIFLLILVAFQNYSKAGNEKFPEVKFISENTSPLELTDFDPNDLDKKQWQHLGFSEKQATTILKYKKIVGGRFTSKEQFRKCFAVSAEKFADLEHYLALPENNKEAASGNFKSLDKKTITVSRKFNPDHYSADDWIQMGFTERQAEAILKYKTYLGGSFTSKESSSSTVACRLRWSGTSRPSPRIASRVRQLIGMPSITCVRCRDDDRARNMFFRNTPAITDQRRSPVHNKPISTARSISGLRAGCRSVAGGRQPGGSPKRAPGSLAGPRNQAIARHGATRCRHQRAVARISTAGALPRPSSPSAASRSPAC